MSQPVVAGITAVMSELAAVAVGFGIINNNQAGLALSLGNGLVVLGVLIFGALHKHTEALRASVSPPPGTVVPIRRIPPPQPVPPIKEAA